MRVLRLPLGDSRALDIALEVESSVKVVVERGKESGELQLSSPPGNRRLEVEWVRSDGLVVGALRLELRGAQGGDPDEATLTAGWSGTRPRAHIDGPLSAEAWVIDGVDTEARSPATWAGSREIRVTASTVRSISVEGVTIDVQLGELHLLQENGVVSVLSARRARLGSNLTRPVQVKEAEDCAFDGAVVSVARYGRLARCAGTLTLGRSADARISGTPDEPLEIKGVSAGDDQQLGPLLGGASLVDVALPRDIQGLMQVLDAVQYAAVFEPAVESIGEALRSLGDADAERVAEILYERLACAQRPSTVDESAHWVLWTRAKRLDWKSGDWWLLGLFRLFGNGRRIRRPLGIWLTMAAVIAAGRIAWALIDPSGLLYWDRYLESELWARFVYVSADGLLAVVLLPFTILRLSGLDDPILRLAGGYLWAARLVLAVPALFALAAIRRRVSTRPRRD